MGDNKKDEENIVQGEGRTIDISAKRVYNIYMGSFSPIKATFFIIVFPYKYIFLYPPMSVDL